MNSDIAILGAGFIGKNLLKHCVGRNYSVRVLDRNPCPPEFESELRWVRGSFMDSCDVEVTVKGAAVVFHFISSTVPADTVDENEELFSNVIQTINLLNICVRTKVERVVFISSASVYGMQSTYPIPETAPTNPISSHGVHKLTIEKYLQLFKYRHGLDCKIMRLGNPYGFGQKLFGRQGIISIAIGKLLSGEKMTIRGDGSAIRDFVHIDDVVKALWLLAESKSDESVFNIGSGMGMSLNDALKVIAKYASRQLNVEYRESRKADIAKSVLDISKAANVLGYKPEIPFDEGVGGLMASYLAM